MKPIEVSSERPPLIAKLRSFLLVGLDVGFEFFAIFLIGGESGTVRFQAVQLAFATHQHRWGQVSTAGEPWGIHVRQAAAKFHQRCFKD